MFEILENDPWMLSALVTISHPAMVMYLGLYVVYRWWLMLLCLEWIDELWNDWAWEYEWDQWEWT